MPRQKSQKKLTSKIIQTNEEKKTTPRTAKIVLFVFGIGPLILMCLFLFTNGFFNSPWSFYKSLAGEVEFLLIWKLFPTSTHLAQIQFF